MPAASAALPADRSLPLLGRDEGLPVAWRDAGPVSQGEYSAHVRALAGRLTGGRYVLNACEDRYRFLVAFGAALVRNQTCLLPHNRTEQALRHLQQDYAGARLVGDRDVEDALASGAGDAALPSIGRDHIAAIVFTSGSTGEPAPHWKRWGTLVDGARLVQARYGVHPAPGTVLVATVAPQHMFGLEASVMLPLASGVSLHAACPFFPADLRRTLAEAPPRRILVTTPHHLDVFLQSGIAWPQVDLIISATAPMGADLAARAEQAFGARLMEIFGSTESGAIASRRPAAGEPWRLYDGLRLTNMASLHYVDGPHLGQRVALNDRIELEPDGRFRLLGRDEDLVKIGGKRCSLGDLNRTLADIPGVVEGVFVVPEENPGAVTRLAALVVAPGQSPQAILQALAACIDPTFLPRPLHLVERLPHNETGKLVRKDLLALLDRLGAAR